MYCRKNRPRYSPERAFRSLFTINKSLVDGGVVLNGRVRGHAAAAATSAYGVLIFLPSGSNGVAPSSHWRYGWEKQHQPARSLVFCEAQLHLPVSTCAGVCSSASVCTTEQHAAFVPQTSGKHLPTLFKLRPTCGRFFLHISPTFGNLLMC